MRWIFYALVIINLGYLGWQTLMVSDNGVQPPSKKDSAVQGEMLELQLLSEARDQLWRLEKSPGVEVQNQLNDGSVLSDEVMTPLAELLPGQENEGPAGQCLVFGPFLESVQKDDVVDYLEKTGFKVMVSRQAVTMKSRYWAYIEPFATPRSAMEMMSKIKANGVEAFLIADGELVNGLSLGVFETEAQIEKVTQSLSDLQVEIKLSEKSNGYEYFEVIIDPANGELPGQETLFELQERYPQVKYRQKVCKSVASVE